MTKLPIIHNSRKDQCREGKYEAGHPDHKKNEESLLQGTGDRVLTHSQIPTCGRFNISFTKKNII